MLRSIAMLPLIAATLLSSGCLKGGFLLKGSECPEGQTRTGGSLCVPVTAESSKLGVTTCKDVDLSAVKAGFEVTMCDGSIGVGTFAACSEDGQMDCAASADFPVVKKSNVEPSDIRHGKTIAGIAGTKRDMKQCRNAAHLATWDANSLAEAQADTNSQLGNLDPWDTIDDYNADGTSPTQSPWGASYVCDSSNFTNVSTAGLAGLTPTGGPVGGGNQNFTAIWRDELTGLYFTNPLKNNAAGSIWQVTLAPNPGALEASQKSV